MSDKAIIKYRELLVEWDRKFKKQNRPKGVSLDEWRMEKSMSKPNKPGYYRANND